MRQLICDKCGAKIPNTQGMQHNEATKQYSGTFSSGNGVVLLTLLDLCGSCAEKVKAFILKGDSS